jgi:hypothetical protein
MKRAIGAATVVALMSTAVGLIPGAAGGATRGGTVDVGFQHASQTVERGTLTVSQTLPFAGPARLGAAAAGVDDAQVGDQRIWFYFDQTDGSLNPDFFTLRAVGEHIEVWVQDDTTFPDGDCRNDGERNMVTDAQVQYLVNQFDTNIYPKESAVFSVPRSRDGSSALAGPPGYFAGDGDKIVTLVENVRDENYYDKDSASLLPYIGGFFSAFLDQVVDRNVMTVDVWDWKHRTGANPPDEPSTDPCTSAPARPFDYEATFAHEYQHLLESYEDPDEVEWVNEGLADWAQTLTGYVDPTRPITDKGFDGHIQCFLGWLSVATPVNPIPRPECGPENSLTQWLEKGDPFILADYGATYSLMELLSSRYGDDFMTALHRDDGNGLVGLQDVLDSRSGRDGKGHGKDTAQDVIHDWELAVALDGLVDGKQYHLKGGPVKKGDVTVKTLDATVNWDNPHAYDAPGAPSNGADYVRLRDAKGQYLSGDDINSLSFSAPTTLPTQPVEWIVDPNPPTHTGNAALYSGADNRRDEAIVRPIAVGTGAAATLTFDAFWNEEDTWDFGFVQISDDGGSTYQSLSCTNTTSDADPQAAPAVLENVPGFSGFSETFRPQTCSLAAYAGKTVLLAFRAINDELALGNDPIPVTPGFWVDNVKVGTTSISDGSTLAGWKSFTETKPNTVAGFTIWLVSVQDKKKGGEVTVKPLELNADFSVKGKVKVNKLFDKKADFVAAIVAYDDPTETSFQYAPYTLTVNGVVQPGGS